MLSFDEVPDDFFLPPTSAEIDAYDHDVLQAVRTKDIATLQRFHAAGRPLKCSNKFGESILHLACRKGLYHVAAFLIQQAQVPVQVCDDYGRTPLHDACWSGVHHHDDDPTPSNTANNNSIDWRLVHFICY